MGAGEAVFQEVGTTRVREQAEVSVEDSAFREKRRKGLPKIERQGIL